MPCARCEMMPQRSLPREYYLKRAVQCYEQAGEPRAAAEALAAFGTPATSTEAAQRFLTLGDLAAAGEALLSAGQARAALSCFQQAQLPVRELACLEALGDDAAAGTLLLQLGRFAEAVPLLERALVSAGADDPARRASLCLRLGAALGEPEGQIHYREGLALLANLPATAASANPWLALVFWGEASGRQDRIQEGYAQAMRLLEQGGDITRWRAVATAYREAAQRMGNRHLARLLDAWIDEARTR